MRTQSFRCDSTVYKIASSRISSSTFLLYSCNIAFNIQTLNVVANFISWAFNKTSPRRTTAARTCTAFEIFKHRQRIDYIEHVMTFLKMQPMWSVYVEGFNRICQLSRGLQWRWFDLFESWDMPHTCSLESRLLENNLAQMHDFQWRCYSPCRFLLLLMWAIWNNIVYGNSSRILMKTDTNKKLHIIFGIQRAI